MSKLIVNYKLLEPVGSGQYGKVFKAENIDDKQIYAAKCIPREMIEGNAKIKECIINEINTLTKINCEFVIKFIEMHKTQNNAYLIYEFCDGGTIERAMFENGYFREKEALEYFKELIIGFQAIEEVAVIHRDLKPQNILLQNNKVKIADFGFCKPLKSKNDLTSTVLGSPIYMAPEIMKGEKYGVKSDIWSLGIVFYEILLGICPYEGTSLENMIELISKGQPSFPSRFSISESTQSTIRRMLEPNPINRISWSELFEMYGSKKPMTLLPPMNVDFNFTRPKEMTTIVNRTPEISPDRIVSTSPIKHKPSYSPSNREIPGFSSNLTSQQQSNSINRAFSMNVNSSSQARTLINGLLNNQPLNYSSKSSVMLALLHCRNRVLFGMELAMNLLNTALNKNLLLARNVFSILLKETENFISELKKPFGGVYLSQLNIPRSEVTESKEFRDLISYLEKEKDLLNEIYSQINRELGFSNSFLSVDYEGIAKDLYSFGKNLTNDSQRNNSLLANQIFDVLLIHEVFDKVLDFNSTYESQAYFDSLKSISNYELIDIVRKKESFISRVIRV